MKPDYKATQLQGITDLTVLSEIKTGFVPGTFDPITYTERLRRVLRILNAIRQASREAALLPSPFADSVGRFRGIHFFRFAVLASNARPEGHQLLLNVTFDGGWEAYMRIIWGPLGTLLDLIFCHCEDYPMAFQSSYTEYMRWVRNREVVSSFFYADSAATVADSRYLCELEALWCSDGARADADTASAGLALPARTPATIPTANAVQTSLRVLKVLDGLREYFPASTDTTGPSITAFEQDGVLRRFTQDTLLEPREWVKQGLFDPGGAFDHLRGSFEPQIRWLMSAIAPPPPAKHPPRFALDAVQAGIAKPYPDEVTEGLLLLLGIEDVDRFKAWLRAHPMTPGHIDPPSGVYRALALTHSGLERLATPRQVMDRLPREFIEGMEARAGILGDLRSNHPDHWTRPRPNWPASGRANGTAAAIELSTVHVALQLRGEPNWSSALDAELHALAASGSGLRVLHVQPMHSAARNGEDVAGRDHFGFADGISQPSLDASDAPPAFWSDRIKAGELFLGHPNDRGDRPDRLGTADPILHNGSFLVVRMLRQYPKRLDRLLDAAVQGLAPEANARVRSVLRETIKAKMMGRRTNGDALVAARGTAPNDFDYRSDALGMQCPFQAHVRRANPREPLPLLPPPRIARRGMSYGPRNTASDEPRGIVFMAYNASIAEQFEVIQRWLAGGNSSGLSSTQSDPLLGVPQTGQRRHFRFVENGEVRRIDLGDEPLVTLEWGLYAFVPSIAAIAAIASGTAAQRKANVGSREAGIAVREGDREVEEAATTANLQATTLDGWRLRLEDDNVRERTWAAVRMQGGFVDADPYGLLVGSAERVSTALQDDGTRFSVLGYGQRMENSIGRGFLGLDDEGAFEGHRVQAPLVNAAIEKITERQAYGAALAAARTYLTRLTVGSRELSGERDSAVDITEYGRGVVAALCAEWFGLPDPAGELMKPGLKRTDDDAADGVPRCPGHLLAVSRYVFAPHPQEEPVERLAKDRGRMVRKAVERLLEKASRPSSGTKLTPLVQDIVDVEAMRADPDLQARTVAGVMLGFAPTVLSNLVSVLIDWVESRTLWEFQQRLEPQPQAGSGMSAAMRAAVLASMGKRPVPYAIWRTLTTSRPFDEAIRHKGCPVILGLRSAIADHGDPMLVFGGDRSAQHPPPHACPGQQMALGVMVGAIVALLAAGTLRRTADPRVLMLTPA